MTDTLADRRRAARAYLATVPVIEQMTAQVLSAFPSLTPEQRDRVSKALRERSEALEGAMLEGITDLMSASEIDALARFYATREGQAIYNKMPLIMADAMKRFSPVLQAVIAEVLR